MTVIAVVAAHPDDEVLGCGGTLVRHAAQGDEVHVLLLADGVAARKGAPKGEVEARQESARSAMRVIGAQPPQFGGFPDNRMDTIALLDVVQAVEDFLSRTKARVVYTHHGGDLNVDHRIVHAAVATACRPVPGSAIEAVYTFEVHSSGHRRASRKEAGGPALLR
jgi:LmbE family N-acetylglucosaminyl deacetylase